MTTSASSLSDPSSAAPERVAQATDPFELVPRYMWIATERDREGTWLSRLVWLGMFAVAFAVVLTAAYLTPDPAGHGTHTQLGLPPCGFLVVTGLPCPGCGLTTSFTNMMILDVVAAARANPFGIPLFLVTFFSIPISFVGLIRKWPVLDTLERFSAEKIAVGLAAAGVVTWLVRFAIAMV